MKCILSSFFAVFLAICVAAALPTQAAAISADDFLPPVQADSEQAKEDRLAINEPDAVKTEVDQTIGVEVTTARTLQDAVNDVVLRKKKGCKIVQLSPDGGQTFVATGKATYKSDYANVNASRIDQRNAYVKAFLDAKAEMTQTVGEMVIRGANSFDSRLEGIDTASKSLTNIESELTEEQILTVRKVLKGFVTYAVFDDDGVVTVSIVSSPKTRGKYSRSGIDGVSASDLRDGLNAVIAEVKSGLVPPVGGRIIQVPGTNEVAFVGFGSAIVRFDKEPDVQEKNKLTAERIASTRAVDALAGIIIGDDTLYQQHVDETTTSMTKDFERMQADDQTTKGTEAEIQEFEERKREFRSVLRDDTRIHSLRSGVLPPGIMRDTDIDPEEYFAYGIAVYVPSISAEAIRSSREMDDAQLMQTPTSSAGSAAQTQQDGAQPIQKGHSGIVEQDL